MVAEGEVSATGEKPKSPYLFFLLVMLVSAPFLPLYRVSLFPREILFFPIGALIVWVPFFVSLGLTFRESGRAGAFDLLRNAVDFGRIRDKIWLVPIIGMMPVALYAAYGLSLAMGQDLPGPTRFMDSPFFYLSFTALLLFPFGIAEELGWTGYAIRPLSERWGALIGGLIVGCVWAAWHIPAHIILGRSVEWIVWHSLVAILLRILIVWIGNNNRGSILAAAVFHAMFNVSYRIYPQDGSLYDPRATAIVLGVAVFVVVLLWGPKTLAKLRSP